MNVYIVKLRVNYAWGLRRPDNVDVVKEIRAFRKKGDAISCGEFHVKSSKIHPSYTVETIEVEECFRTLTSKECYHVFRT